MKIHASKPVHVGKKYITVVRKLRRRFGKKVQPTAKKVVQELLLQLKDLTPNGAGGYIAGLAKRGLIQNIGKGKSRLINLYPETDPSISSIPAKSPDVLPVETDQSIKAAIIAMKESVDLYLRIQAQIEELTREREKLQPVFDRFQGWKHFFAEVG